MQTPTRLTPGLAGILQFVDDDSAAATGAPRSLVVEILPADSALVVSPWPTKVRHALENRSDSHTLQ
jgi:hypothetical protein